MNKKDFAALLAGVQQLGQHMRGKPVPGARVKKVDACELGSELEH